MTLQKTPIKGRMPGNRRPVPGMYYEKVYSNSILLLDSGLYCVYQICSSFDTLSIRHSCEEIMLNK